jgi:DNA-binding LacI/PurR family transcriptional regulator
VTLARYGICVPEKVSIIGTDDLPLGEASWPALTPIRFDATALGARVIDLFHALYQGQPLPEELIRPLVPSLILRKSTRYL